MKDGTDTAIYNSVDVSIYIIVDRPSIEKSFTVAFLGVSHKEEKVKYYQKGRTGGWSKQLSLAVSLHSPAIELTTKG
jgi:hypothetical protein